ncbi:MAG: hypothetical protein LBO20_11215, partial [Bifidobacteriaceae bacterium]|nr:hypothetical protein [Bifidobacteriaceae bacterium]
MAYHRPLEWHRVDLGEDPTPGAVEVIEHEAAEYRQAHSHIVETISGLRSIDYGGLSGKAVEAHKQRAQEVADLLAAAEGRYAAAPQALDSFAQALPAQQRTDANLLNDAIGLADQLSAAETAANDAARKLGGLG